MNVGQMLDELGYKEKPARAGFPCPAVIMSYERGPIGFTAMIETPAEIDAFVQDRKSLDMRTNPNRYPTRWI
jgi:hypothetical protein